MTNVCKAIVCGAALTAPFTNPATAQHEQAAVMAIVNRLFDGMRARDGDIVRSAFHPNAVMISLRDDSVATSSPEGFATAVGRSQDEQWNEPIWDTTVHIDADVASVWTRYAFFRGPNGDQFSHCGFDAIILHLGSEGWKISALTDTHQTENCEMPPGG